MPSYAAISARWVLELWIVVLAAAGVIGSIPTMIEAGEFYGPNGDARGMIFTLGSAQVAVTAVSRLLDLFSPSSWKTYLRRAEFTLISMFWICWTSATMSFSIYTLNESTCQPSRSETMLPSCSLVSFDLTLLHILSISTFIQLLMILSSMLSAVRLGAKDGNKDGGEGFVMWELALASPPHSPRLGPSAMPAVDGLSANFATYGATSISAVPAQLAASNGQSEQSLAATDSGSKRRDKFAVGRRRTYVPLAFGSLAVLFGALMSTGSGAYNAGRSGGLLAAVGLATFIFSVLCFSLHFRDGMRSSPVDADLAASRAKRARFERALEVGIASVLFLLWPIAAISYSLFPPTPTRACANPEASAAPSPDEDYDPDAYQLCTLGWVVITVSWLATWLLLVRLLGLVFPSPTTGLKFTPLSAGPKAGEEGRALLGASGSRRVAGDSDVDEADMPAAQRGKSRGWQRVTAGEEFELGSDEE
ncbi:hypothetical protein IAU60_001739 [Kwoniella sp. DSM 27419]